MKKTEQLGRLPVFMHVSHHGKQGSNISHDPWLWKSKEPGFQFSIFTIKNEKIT
jgi:hypothetical protein